MGKQYDKVIKRRRRAAYLERRKLKAKEAAVAAAKPRPRKPAAKKPAPAAPARTPEPVEAGEEAVAETAPLSAGSAPAE